MTIHANKQRQLADHLNEAHKDFPTMDPATAHAIRSMKTVFDSLFPRNSDPYKVSCKCGGIAVWDHEEKNFACDDCERTWSAD